jgi:hypothetical protein
MAIKSVWMLSLLTGSFFLFVGFNVEQVTYKNLKFQVWDLGEH